MAIVVPFRALRYDPALVSLDKVVTQPYDKITPQMQASYYDASPYNLVRIILNKHQTNDSEGDNPYTRAASHFLEWRRKGIFLQDAQPSIYCYYQRFQVPDTDCWTERRGFIALGRVEDYSANVVFRHEQTLAKPKADRLQLLRATRAHFGQIFMLYSDPGNELEFAFDQDRAPEIEVKDENGVQHRICRVCDPATIAGVASKMRDKKLIIADGHHRYETALEYRNERRCEASTAQRGMGRSDSAGGMGKSPHPEDAPYERVMMTFVNMESEGLVILPTHRVVHGLSSFGAEKFLQDANVYFHVDQVFGSLDSQRVRNVLAETGKRGTAILASTGAGAFLLKARAGAAADLLSNYSSRQQSLDVVQLHGVLLEHVLHISSEAIREQRNVSYVRSATEALTRVHDGAQLAFLMNPVRTDQVRDIAFGGEVLPQKSTDFYPKLLSGLTIYALD